MKEYIYFKHLSSIQAQFSKFSIIITTLHIPLLLKMTILSFNLSICHEVMGLDAMILVF